MVLIYNKRPSGTYELDPSGRSCFRPRVPQAPPLEDVIDVLDPAAAAIRAFERALADWDGSHSALIGRLFARLDAVHSSGAEGTTSTFTDLMEYESSRHTAADPDDAATVAACALAFEAGAADAGDPVDMSLAIHRRLFEGARDRMAAATAGRLKERTNGTADPDASGGLFYYTQPASVPQVLAEWRDFTLIDDPRTPELVRQALSHWMFEHIHPVADGNGRIGRLLVPIMLKRKGATQRACAFFGEAVHEDKDLYVEALKTARISADMTAWTRLMLSFLTRSAAANLERLTRLTAIAAAWRDAVARFRADSMVHKLAPFALTRPVFTIEDARRAIGGTFASVNTAAAHLVDAGILVIADHARRDRLFLAGAVLDVFDRFRPLPAHG
jgi:cell filamentation protein, protein adenylyltransferase